MAEIPFSDNALETQIFVGGKSHGVPGTAIAFTSINIAIWKTLRQERQGWQRGHGQKERNKPILAPLLILKQHLKQ